MLKRGPKPMPDSIKRLRGSFQKSRAQPKQLPIVDAKTPVMPSFLQGRAEELWHERIKSYDARGLNVRGAERVLAHLCALDAQMEATWLRGETPTSAQVTALRAMSSMFYEPPASQPGGGALTPPRKPSPYDEFQTEPSPWNEIFPGNHS